MLKQKKELNELRDMTRGLCHEINNPLSVILLTTTSLKRKLERMGGLEDEVKRLDKAIEGTDRISRLMKELRHL